MLTVFVVVGVVGVVGVVEEPLSPSNGRARKMTRSWLCQSGARISEAPAAAEERSERGPVNGWQGRLANSSLMLINLIFVHKCQDSGQNHTNLGLG